MVEILYADPHIAVCVKPAGILSQDAGSSSMPQLLREQLGVDYVGVIHRLDREVGGVMVFALNPGAAAKLSRSVQNDQLEKIYTAVINGAMPDSGGMLEDLLFHDKMKNKTYTVKRERKGVKKAVLEYETLKIWPKHSLLRITLHTGRTHQIRVQFASRGASLVGDGKYGGKQQGIPLLLWSGRLAFPHPNSGARMCFEQAPVWEDRCDEWFT